MLAPGTAEEIASRDSRLRYQSVSTRVSELRRGEYVEDVRRGTTSAHSTANVVAITDRGRRAVEAGRRALGAAA